MTNTVSIRYMISGSIFDEIKYNNFNELCDKLKSIILNYDFDILIKILINDEILNYHDAINTSLLLNINENTCVSVILSDKKKLYCLRNKNGIYVLDSYCDKYSKLLKVIIEFYENDSYDIIMNSSYKDLVLRAIRFNGSALEYVSIDLQNDKEIVLECIRQNEYALEYAGINLHNNKEFILESINAGCAISYVKDIFRNDKEVMLAAVKKSGRSLYYASTKLQDNKDIVLEAVKQHGRALIFASERLKKNKIIALEAVKQCGRALTAVNKRLRKDKDIILAYNQHI